MNKTSLEEIVEKIYKDPDFINYPALNNSLKQALRVHPDGFPVDKIARALMISEEEVEKILACALAKIKASLGE